MGLLRALRLFDGPASILGLNCVFANGKKHSANVLYCICGLSAKIAVSVLCLRSVVSELAASSPHHLNIINMLLLAAYKFFSILLFLSVIYFHVRKDANYRKMFATLTEVAQNCNCYQELFHCLRKNSTIAGALAFSVIFCMFLAQVTQIGLGPKLDVAHSAVTAFTCMYFEIKFAIAAKATLFVLKKVNCDVRVAAWAPVRLSDLRASHEKLYQLVDDAGHTFQCVLIFSAILQFQVALYSSYVACINVWELEATFMQIKIKLMLITSVWVFAIVANYVHLTSTCSATLAEAQNTANLLLKLEMHEIDYYFREEIKLFRNQVLHHRHYTYNIFGLFCINKSFVCVVLGGLATYLATLVQFHLVASQLPTGG